MLAEFLKQTDPEHERLVDKLLQTYSMAQLAQELKAHYGKTPVWHDRFVVCCALTTIIAPPELFKDDDQNGLEQTACRHLRKVLAQSV